MAKIGLLTTTRGIRQHQEGLGILDVRSLENTIYCPEQVQMCLNSQWALLTGGSDVPGRDVIALKQCIYENISLEGPRRGGNISAT